jgi:hypothetical protein
MFITLINDSRDDNSMARLATRFSAILDAPVHRIGVENDMQVAGNLIDVLDAGMGMFGAVLANFAPRAGILESAPSQKVDIRDNGSPFVYFFYKDTLAVSTVDGFNLSLIKKFNLVDRFELINISDVLDKVGRKHGLSEHTQARMKATQFRSLEFLPFLAKWLLGGESVPSQSVPIERVPDAPLGIWWIDSFGNCKTTITPMEIGFEVGKKITTKVGELKCYLTLKDVPAGEEALIIGSSGIESNRLLEVVLQGGSAQKRFNFEVGDRIF